MKQKISSMRQLAEHLIECEARSASSRGATLPAEPVCDKLRPPLATLMGTTGFRALLTRALARATVKVPGLRTLQVNPAGMLELLPAAGLRLTRAQGIEGSVVLITELLTLLYAFIGMNLTLQLVRDIWADLPINESSFEPGDSE